MKELKEKETKTDAQTETEEKKSEDPLSMVQQQPSASSQRSNKVRVMIEYDLYTGLSTVMDSQVVSK